MANIENKSQSTPLPFIKLLIQSLGLTHCFSSILDSMPASIVQSGHGRRFLTWWRLLSALAVMVGGYKIWVMEVKIEIFDWTLTLLHPHEATIWGVGGISIFIGFAVWRRIGISWRRFRGVEVHVLSRGSHYFGILGLPNAIVFQILHPLLILSTAVWIPVPAVQLFLAVTAVATFVRVGIDRFFLERQRDDFTAGTIEGNQLKQPASAVDADSTIVSTSENMPQGSHSTTDDAYSELPKHLRNIIYRSETQ